MPRLRRWFFDLWRWCKRELSEKELDWLRSFAALRMTAETGLCWGELDEGQERI